MKKTRNIRRKPRKPRRTRRQRGGKKIIYLYTNNNKMKEIDIDNMNILQYMMMMDKQEFIKKDDKIYNLYDYLNSERIKINLLSDFFKKKGFTSEEIIIYTEKVDPRSTNPPRPTPNPRIIPLTPTNPPPDFDDDPRYKGWRQ